MKRRRSVHGKRNRHGDARSYVDRGIIARGPAVRAAIQNLTAVAVVLFAATGAAAQNATIAQVDPSRILVNQEVRLYVSVTDDFGDPVEGLEAEQFSVFEAPGSGEDFVAVEDVSVVEKANVSAGINFFLLVDNSGSMYDTLLGDPTEAPEEMRMAHTKQAIREFLNDMTNPEDTVGLASFNTFFTLHTEPTQNKLTVYNALDEIERPERAEGYTELYAAVDRAAEIMGELRGRKVIIVLSDGENYPYARFEPEDHPEYGEKIWTFEEPIESLKREAVSAFAVNFGRDRDPNLEDIATESGGAVFDAANQRELANVYGEIRERVLKEYLISYPATMEPAVEKQVRVIVDIAGAELSDTRAYFSSTIFGLPMEEFSPWFLLPLLLALAAWLGLTQLKLENRADQANLEILDAGGGKAGTRVMSLGPGQTVIGGNEDADLTIAGARELKQNHATIVHDEKTGKYTVVSDAVIRVNNKPAKKRDLESGDVLNVGGTIIVFDEPKK